MARIIKQKVSIIVPTYNEQRDISACLSSLINQNYPNSEIIVVDDGSIDDTVSRIKKFPVLLLTQTHLGAGLARNLGAKRAAGEILVFVDADMTFSPEFVSNLIKPILEQKTIGTFSKEEFVSNPKNIWSKCWNYNLGRGANFMDPRDYSGSKNALYLFGKNIWEQLEKSQVKTISSENRQHVFRAILKEEFLKVGGFDENVGYTDDWSIAEKLKTKAAVASGAVFYHRNPDNLKEVWTQARWFGKNEFLTRNLVRRLYSLVRYNPVYSLIKGIVGSLKIKEPGFLVFKLIYDSSFFQCAALLF